MKWRSRVATLALLFGLASPALADDKELPEKLKEQGFVDSLDAGIKKASADGKVILLFMTPAFQA